MSLALEVGKEGPRDVTFETANVRSDAITLAPDASHTMTGVLSSQALPAS